jgi:hypothetical protein
MVPRVDEALRVIRVRHLFEVRSSDERTETGVVLFYAWLEKHYAHLLPSGLEDPFQRLKADLAGLFK